MRTVTQVLQEMDNEPNEYYRGQILKKYCEEIIDKCTDYVWEEYRTDVSEMPQEIKKLL